MPTFLWPPPAFEIWKLTQDCYAKPSQIAHDYELRCRYRGQIQLLVHKGSVSLAEASKYCDGLVQYDRSKLPTGLLEAIAATKSNSDAN